MTPPTTKGRLARARSVASFDPGTREAWNSQSDELRDFIRDECDPLEHCECKDIAASLMLDGMPATRPRTKGRRP